MMASQERLYELWMLFCTKKNQSYLRQWLDIFISTHEQGVTLSPDIHSSRVHSRLLDLALLPSDFLRVVNVQLKQCAQKILADAEDEHLYLALSLIRATTIVSRNPDSVEEVGSCSIVDNVFMLSTFCIQQAKEHTKEREVCGNGGLDSFVFAALALCEHLYDPCHNWSHRVNGQVCYHRFYFCTSYCQCEMG
uniref:Uncharacterized protein n=1 Tax=Eptatretus burgeri TaxID=7764 RepID=A0A8C4PWC9_EPTBU